MKRHPKAIIIARLNNTAKGTSITGFLHYLQDRRGSVPASRFKPEIADPQQRWVDHGLGSCIDDIDARCKAWQGSRLHARDWVISPDPELVEQVPEQLRFKLIADVTEASLHKWYADNHWGKPEFSYVIHDKHLDDNKDKMKMPHAHIMTPGTIPVDCADPSLGRMDHFINRHHLKDLRQTTEMMFEREMERVLGRERAQEILRSRDERIRREMQRSARNSMRSRFGDLSKLRRVLSFMRGGPLRKNKARDARLLDRWMRVQTKGHSARHPMRSATGDAGLDAARADHLCRVSKLRVQRSRGKRLAAPSRPQGQERRLNTPYPSLRGPDRVEGPTWEIDLPD